MLLASCLSPALAVAETVRPASQVVAGTQSGPVRLGGIGTGWIEWLGADGFGCIAVTHNASHPTPPQPGTFAAVWTEADGRSSARLLTRRPAYDLPSATNLDAQAAYPFATLRCSDPALPVLVSMRAFTPLVPHDVWASSMPVVLITFTVRNVSRAPVGVSVAVSWQTTLGTGGSPGLGAFSDRSRVEAAAVPATDGFAGVRFEGPQLVDEPVRDLRIHNARGTQTIVATYPTPDAEVSTASWNAASRRPEWWSGFERDGRVTGETAAGRDGHVHPAGVVSVRLELRANEVRDVNFAVAWHAPRAYVAGAGGAGANSSRTDQNVVDIPPPYADRFADALSVARLALEDRASLAALTAEWQAWFERSVVGRPALAGLTEELNEAITSVSWRKGGSGEAEPACPAMLVAETAVPLATDRRLRLQRSLLALFPSLDAGDIEWRLIRSDTPHDCRSVSDCAQLVRVHLDATSARGWLNHIWPRLRDTAMPILRGSSDCPNRRNGLTAMLDLATLANDADAARECASLLAGAGSSPDGPAGDSPSQPGAWERWHHTMGCSYDPEHQELRLIPAMAVSAVRMAGPVLMPYHWGWCDWRQLPVRTTVEFRVNRMMPMQVRSADPEKRSVQGPPFEVRRVVMRPPRTIKGGEVRAMVGLTPIRNNAQFMPDGMIEVSFGTSIRLGPGDRLSIEVLAAE